MLRDGLLPNAATIHLGCPSSRSSGHFKLRLLGCSRRRGTPDTWKEDAARNPPTWVKYMKKI